MQKIIRKIKKMRRIIHPRLAAGTCFLSYLLVFLILEKITKFQFVSKHIMILTLIFLPLVGIIYTRFDKTYDRENNDDSMFYVIGALVGILFFVLLFAF